MKPISQNAKRLERESQPDNNPRGRNLAGALMAGLLGSTTVAWAGETTPVAADTASAEPEGDAWNFAEAYRNMGKIYENEDAPFLQSFSLFGAASLSLRLC